VVHFGLDDPLRRSVSMLADHLRGRTRIAMIEQPALIGAAVELSSRGRTAAS
jgi:hypothetical protein